MDIIVKMKLAMIMLCVVMTCGPLMVSGQKKMIFVIPRAVRRVQSTPWHHHLVRPTITKSSKPLLDKEFPSRNLAYPYHKFTKVKPTSLYSQHLQDFDQTTKKVNHVVIPQGKGITQAFGSANGYIPHEPIKSSLTDHLSGVVQHSDEVNYYSHHPPVTQQTDNYIHGDEEVQERRTDHQRAKYLMYKNLGKPSVNKMVYDFPKKPYFSPLNFYNKDELTLPAGRAPEEVAGASKGSIVLRGGLDLSNYEKKLMELANTWPGGLHSSAAAALSVDHSGAVGGPQLSASNFQSNNFGGLNLVSNLGPQGYAVQEEVQEEMSHDFRAQPIQAGPQAHTQQVLRAAVPPSQYAISPAPFMPSLQFPVPQGAQRLPSHLRVE